MRVCFKQTALPRCEAAAAGQETPALLLGPSPKACPGARRKLLICAHLQELTKTHTPSSMAFVQPFAAVTNLGTL